MRERFNAGKRSVSERFYSNGETPGVALLRADGAVPRANDAVRFAGLEAGRRLRSIAGSRPARCDRVSRRSSPALGVWSAGGEVVVHLEELDVGRPRDPDLLGDRADRVLRELFELLLGFPHIRDPDSGGCLCDPVEQ